MSKQISGKKRKTDQPASLKEALDTAKNQIPFFSGIKDFLNSDLLKRNSELLYGLLNGVYKADASEVNTHVVPTALRTYDVTRNSQGVIVQIADKQGKKKVSNVDLKKVLALEGAKALNAEYVIFGTDDENLEMLVIPKHQQIEVHLSNSQKDDNDNNVTVYGLKRHSPFFATAEELKQFLKLSYITLRSVTNVVNDVNQVARVTVLPDVKNLKNVNDILKTMQASDADRKPKILFERLMTVALETSTDEDKLIAFESHPTANLARQLELSTIYAKALYTKTRASAKKVIIADLDDEAFVYINKTPISESEYNELPADISSELVYEAFDHFGTIRGGRWNKAFSVKKMQKKHIIRFYEAAAKSAANQTGEEYEPTGESDSTNEYDDV